MDVTLRGRIGAAALPVTLVLAMAAGPLGCEDVAPVGGGALAGPVGAAYRPGPWPVRVLSRGPAPRLFAAIGDDTPSEIPLARDEADVWLGWLPDAPEGSQWRYFAQAGEWVAPDGAPDAPHRFQVRTLPAPAPPDVPPSSCVVAFVSPSDGARLSAADDSAPQAGLQITVRAEIRATPPAPTYARLLVDETGYVAAVVREQVAFRPVTLPPGARRLLLEAQPVSGLPCRAELEVRVDGP